MTTASAWLEAARPRTLPAAVSPVLVGAGLAAGDGSLHPGALIGALVGALAIQVAANFANDVADATRGADPVDRVGPRRMVASGEVSAQAMWRGVWVAVGVATVAGLYLILLAGWVVALIGVVSVAAMLTYTGGPLPYGYRGLGEAAVFVFFGLVATVGSRYVHDGTAPVDAWLLGVVMGLLASAILVANNLRDIDTDARAGKRTLAVILGPGRTRLLYSTLLAAGFGVIALGAVTGLTEPLTGLALLTVPMAVSLIRGIRSEQPVTLIRVLVGTARLQLAVGVVLAISAAV